MINNYFKTENPWKIITKENIGQFTFTNESLLILLICYKLKHSYEWIAFAYYKNYLILSITKSTYKEIERLLKTQNYI